MSFIEIRKRVFKKKDKICSKCGLSKSYDEFYKRKETKDGLHSQCKICHNNIQKHYDNKRSILKTQKEKYKKEFTSPCKMWTMETVLIELRRLALLKGIEEVASRIILTKGVSVSPYILNSWIQEKSYDPNPEQLICIKKYLNNI